MQHLALQDFVRTAWFGLCCLGCAGLLLPESAVEFAGERAAVAQQAPEKAGPEKGAENLPLKQVVMFSSGVAFFEHSGQVQGDSQLHLSFKSSNINDLLKSMVLQDLDGGKISTVTYTSRDPVTRTLGTFTINLTHNPSLADLLGQIRGEQVEVDAPNRVIGTIVGVETKRVRQGDDLAEVPTLNLLTEQGLRSFPLEKITRLKLVNPRLDAELRQALEVLAQGHDDDKKSVQLQFLGNGQRRVRVGYIQEAPIWKTSYRLVLNDGKEPFLQGWAIVENTTENDWKNVNLTLVSGRPISFIMDLYTPLYVDRPWVQPELYASLRPQTYDQDLDRAEADFERMAAAPADAKAAREMRDEQSARYRGAFAGEGKGEGRAAGRPLGGAAPGKIMQPGDSVQSMAQAGEVGELFQYVIDTPVSLARRRAAMLPIVNASVKGEKVSIYNPSVQAKHPLNGLQLVNSTGLNLMQGPVTVYDDGVYAGDARIQDLSAGTTRLISYALDLDTEVAPEPANIPSEMVTVRLVRGTLEVVQKYRRTMNYTVKHSGKNGRKVLIEQPLEAGWKLIEPAKAEETTRDLYRFAVQAEPGKPTKLKVTEERVAQNNFAVSNLNDDTIRIYLLNPVVTEDLKKALKTITSKRQAIAELNAERNRLQQQIDAINADQARIRQNMAQLSQSSELYGRYVRKFTQQEDQIETLRTSIARLTGQIDTQQREFNEFLQGLVL